MQQLQSTLQIATQAPSFFTTGSARGVAAGTETHPPVEGPLPVWSPPAVFGLGVGDPLGEPLGRLVGVPLELGAPVGVSPPAMHG